VTGAHVTGDSNGPVLHLRPVRRSEPLRRPRAGAAGSLPRPASNVARRRCSPCLCAVRPRPGAPCDAEPVRAPDLPVARAPARPARVAPRLVHPSLVLAYVQAHEFAPTVYWACTSGRATRKPGSACTLRGSLRGGHVAAGLRFVQAVRACQGARRPSRKAPGNKGSL